MFRRRDFVLVLLLSWIGSFVLAGEPIKVWNLKAGCYGVQNGVIVPAIIVNPDDPVPPPVVPPIPDGLTVRAKEIKRAAEAITSDPTKIVTAWKLAVTYREIAKKVETGEIAGQETIAFWIKTATDMLLTSGTQAAWQPTRDVLADQWARLINSGADDRQFAILLGEVASGLESLGPKPQAVDLQMSYADLFSVAADYTRQLESEPQALDWAKIMQIIMMIMEILSKLR